MSENDRANAFLARANLSIQEMTVAKIALSADANETEKRRSWSLFLSEFRKALRFLEQAARNESHNSWADNLERERKENQTLTYVFHARNADEHGVVSGHQTVPAALSIGNMFLLGGSNTNITISNCQEIVRHPDGSTTVRRVDGKFSTKDGVISDGWLRSEVPVSRSKPYLRLGEVADRGQTYSLPNLGGSDHDLAHGIAQFACNWVGKKYSEISKMLS